MCTEESSRFCAERFSFFVTLGCSAPCFSLPSTTTPTQIDLSFSSCSFHLLPKDNQYFNPAHTSCKISSNTSFSRAFLSPLPHSTMHFGQCLTTRTTLLTDFLKLMGLPWRKMAPSWWWDVHKTTRTRRSQVTLSTLPKDVRRLRPFDLRARPHD